MTHSLVLVANAGDGSLSLFRFDGAALERLSVTEGLTGCSTFAVDSTRDLVYAAVKGDPAGIVTLSLDRAAGVLTEVSRRDLPRGGMNYLALTHDGEVLLGASYGGGYGILSTVADGVVSAPVSEIAYANLHAVLPDASGRFAYFVSLGDDLVAQYAITDEPSLEPLSPSTVAFPPGIGPRHLALNAAEDSVYVLTEFSAEIVRLHRDRQNGVLVPDGSTAAHDVAVGLPPACSEAIPPSTRRCGEPTCTGVPDRSISGHRSGRRAVSQRCPWPQTAPSVPPRPSRPPSRSRADSR